MFASLFRKRDEKEREKKTGIAIAEPFGLRGSAITLVFKAGDPKELSS